MDRLAVLDACAVLALLRAEPGGEVVFELLRRRTCWIHSLNLCEVFYDLGRFEGIRRAEFTIQQLLTIGLFEDSTVSPAPWRKVGKLKATRRRVSLADCFAIDLAQRLDATLYTADRRELSRVARES